MSERSADRVLPHLGMHCLMDTLKRGIPVGVYPLVVDKFRLIINFCYNIRKFELTKVQCKINAALQYFYR